MPNTNHYLKNHTAEKILNALANTPTTKNQSQISRETEISIATTFKIIKKLKKDALITQEKKGRQQKCAITKKGLNILNLIRQINEIKN